MLKVKYALLNVTTHFVIDTVDTNNSKGRTY